LGCLRIKKKPIKNVTAFSKELPSTTNDLKNFLSSFVNKNPNLRMTTRGFVNSNSKVLEKNAAK
jgi:hypothetical protein